ncbi:MAG: class I SAM-dependent methyltransferase [Candidatus Wallbacteria bacterium]|nr:class I SAM-dependent methyltransferase [Candidatus Wallbacteria bacterium]
MPINRKRLNDLTGSEWKFWSRSVITKPYPRDLQHALRSEHGGQKPPRLCEDLIRVFTHEGDRVLDPLAGVGGTLLGAALAGREAHGIERTGRWAEIYREVCKLEKLRCFECRVGDARDELARLEPESFRFVLTDLPYWDMDRLPKTRAARAAKSKLSRFDAEAGRPKSEWLAEMREILLGAARALAERCYLAVFVGDMYRGNQYHMLGSEVAASLAGSCLTLKANLVWYDVSKSLHVYGYPSAFVPSLTHQNILVFRKESPPPS